MIDVLTYLSAPQTFSNQFHLEGAVGSGNNPTYSLWQQQYLYNMKGSAGWPWDIDVVENTPTGLVYQLVTELDYTSPSNYKIFASSSWPNGKGGVAWCPRFIDPTDYVVPLITADSTYKTYQNCQLTSTQTLGGPIVTTIQFSPQLNAGGQIGVVDCLVQQYMWGGPNLSNLEVNHYAYGFGHWRWTHYTKNASGIYTMVDDRVNNLVKPGGSPAVNFPCGLPS